jgi:hypothetical protein
MNLKYISRSKDKRLGSVRTYVAREWLYESINKIKQEVYLFAYRNLEVPFSGEYYSGPCCELKLTHRHFTVRKWFILNL